MALIDNCFTSFLHVDVGQQTGIKKLRIYKCNGNKSLTPWNLTFLRFRAIAYSLSHLISVLKNLEHSWALAFLRRTRFMDPDFQGDLLAVISKLFYLQFACNGLSFRYSHGFILITNRLSTSPNHAMPTHWSIHPQISWAKCDP